MGVLKIEQTLEILLRGSVVIRDLTLFQFRKKVNPDKIVRVADNFVCYWKGASIQGDLMNRIGVSASAENKSYVPKAGMQICSKLSRSSNVVMRSPGRCIQNWIEISSIGRSFLNNQPAT